MIPTENEARHLAHFWASEDRTIDLQQPGVRDAPSYKRLIEQHWIVPTGKDDGEFAVSAAGVNALKAYFAAL